MTRDPSVMVGGERLFVTAHAAQRYVDKVRPALRLWEATDDLRRVLRFAELTDRCPSFCAPYSLDGSVAERWVVLSELEIAFPVVDGRLLTCLVRAVPDGNDRQERAQARREKASRRRERRFKRDRHAGVSGMRKLRENERRQGRKKAA